MRAEDGFPFRVAHPYGINSDPEFSFAHINLITDDRIPPGTVEIRSADSRATRHAMRMINVTADREWWGEDIIPRIRWRIQGRRGEEIPDGYGIAYHVVGQDAVVMMPIPINLIVGAWLAFWWWMTCPPWRYVGAHIERQLKLSAASRRSGYDLGWEVGHAGYDKYAKVPGWDTKL